MEVIFKLNKNQQERAAAAVEKANAEYEEKSSNEDYDRVDVVLCGNAWCREELEFYWNPNQCLTYDFEKELLILSGERNVIISDGLKDFVKSIIGNDEEVIVEYQSSTPMLRWDECLTSSSDLS